MLHVIIWWIRLREAYPIWLPLIFFLPPVHVGICRGVLRVESFRCVHYHGGVLSAWRARSLLHLCGTPE